MSLLETTTTPPNRIAQKAERLLRAPAQVFNQLLNQWQQGIADIWDDANPQAVLDELGTKAPELFQLSSQLAGFLETMKPGCTAAASAKVKPFTVVSGKVVITVAK